MPSVEPVAAERAVELLMKKAAGGAKIVRRFWDERNQANRDEALFAGRRAPTEAQRSRLENRLRRLTQSAGARFGVVVYDADERRWASIMELEIR